MQKPTDRRHWSNHWESSWGSPKQSSWNQTQHMTTLFCISQWKGHRPGDGHTQLPQTQLQSSALPLTSSLKQKTALPEIPDLKLGVVKYAAEILFCYKLEVNVQLFWKTKEICPWLSQNIDSSVSHKLRPIEPYIKFLSSKDWCWNMLQIMNQVEFDKSDINKCFTWGRSKAWSEIHGKISWPQNEKLSRSQN